VATDTLQTEKPAQSLAFKKLLCAFACFFDGELKRFSLNEKNELVLIKNKNKNNPPIMIVARGYYSELAREYPIDNKKELKKLLALEANDSQNSQYHVWGSENEQSQVNSWQFNNSVPSCLIRLPITLLFALTAKVNQIINIQTENPFYVARNNKLIHSLPHSAVVNSTKRFALSAGVAQAETDKIINQHNFTSELALGLKQALPIIASFVTLPQVENRLALLKSITVPSLLVLTAYLALSSGYLVYKQHDLETQLANQNENVSIALNQQVTFDQQLVHYTALKSFLTTQKTISHIWLIMAELFPHAKFSNVRLERERFVLRGETEKATKLLELISKISFVIDSKFDFPTRRNKSQEVFVISFKLINVPPSSNKQMENTNNG